MGVLGLVIAGVVVFVGAIGVGGWGMKPAGVLGGCSGTISNSVPGVVPMGEDVLGTFDSFLGSSFDFFLGGSFLGVCCFSSLFSVGVVS